MTAEHQPNDPIAAASLISVKEAMAALRLSRPTICRLLRKGDLRAKKLGHRTLILGESVRAYVERAPTAVYR